MIAEHTLTNETVEINQEVVVVVNDGPFEGATGYVQTVLATAPGFPSAVAVRLYHHGACGPVYYKPFQLKELIT